MTPLCYTPIGVIRTPFADKPDTPIQGAFHPDAAGVVEIAPELADGLTDIDGFSHLLLIYHLDRAPEPQLLPMPFLSDERHGVFATRHPARPNPLGLTVVRLAGREGSALRVLGVDMLDGTPLLDVKPYIPRFDAVPDAREGWFAGHENRPKPPGRE